MTRERVRTKLRRRAEYLIQSGAGKGRPMTKEERTYFLDSIEQNVPNAFGLVKLSELQVRAGRHVSAARKRLLSHSSVVHSVEILFFFAIFFAISLSLPEWHTCRAHTPAQRSPREPLRPMSNSLDLLRYLIRTALLSLVLLIPKTSRHPPQRHAPTSHPIIIVIHSWMSLCPRFRSDVGYGTRSLTSAWRDPRPC